MLDHLIIGCRDLDEGIVFVEMRTGVRATSGGVHPGRGTRNALLSLGEGRYLEIIAPDPKQEAQTWFAELKTLATPKLIGWAEYPGDISTFDKRLRAAAIACQGPTEGSRARPDGKVLHWQTIHLDDDYGGILPFFIEWSVSSIHPSVDAPAGCQLAHFSVASPDPAAFTKTLTTLGINITAITAEQGSVLQLRAKIVGPKGKGILEITS